MNINVGLVTLAYINKDILVLVEDLGKSYAIPQMPLLEHRNSLYIIKEIIGKVTHITGSWLDVEVGLKQAGVFDDVDRNKSVREILIVYSLVLPDKVTVKEGYKWIKLSDLSPEMYLDHYSIIRYCGVNNGTCHRV